MSSKEHHVTYACSVEVKNDERRVLRQRNVSGHSRIPTALRKEMHVVKACISIFPYCICTDWSNLIMCVDVFLILCHFCGPGTSKDDDACSKSTHERLHWKKQSWTSYLHPGNSPRQGTNPNARENSKHYILYGLWRQHFQFEAKGKKKGVVHPSGLSPGRDVVGALPSFLHNQSEILLADALSFQGTIKLDDLCIPQSLAF